ncbi:alginate O-acetyltransferase AlgX-related protein [Haloechinothrix alba]|nr:hypothetical protein [Haloechinothrix alba]
MNRGANGTLPPVHESWLPRQHVLYRPRHATRQWLALACAAVFFAAPVLTYGLGARAAEIENRELTEFPSPSAGWGFFTGMAPWAVDHLPFRDEAITVADTVSRGLFREPPPLGDGSQGVPLPGDQQPEEDAPDEDAAGNETGGHAAPRVVEGTDGWLYLGVEIDSRCDAQHDFDEMRARLHQLREGVEASGRDFALVVAPDKLTVVPDHLPEPYAGRDCVTDVNQEFWRRIEAEDYLLDLRAELERWGKVLGVPVYPHLDSHWGDEGGVAMARALAEAVEPGISRQWGIEIDGRWSGPADLPPMIGRSGEVDGRSYRLEPDGERDRTRDVDEDFRTPLDISSTALPGMVDRPAMLLGDSFTIRALPYLAASFADLTVLHHDNLREDGGQAVADMLVDKEIVAVQVAERTLVPDDHAIVDPDIIDTVTRTLAANPIE